jgi:hypothetical protein
VIPCTRASVEVKLPWWGWFAGGAAGFVGLEALASARSSTPAIAARGPIAANGDVPPTSIPSSTPVQSRPLPAFEGLDAERVNAIVRVAQRQLNALGLGPLTVDGSANAATQAAIAQFLVDYPPTDDQLAAYGRLTDGREALYVLDDVVRLGASLPAGAAPSGRLFSPARHRGRV